MNCRLTVNDELQKQNRKAAAHFQKSYPAIVDPSTLSTYVNSRCGEIYLSDQGTLIFLCSLCNDSFNGYGIYLEHIINKHDLPVYSVEEINNGNELSDFDSEKDDVGIHYIETVDYTDILPEIPTEQYGTDCNADAKYRNIESHDDNIGISETKVKDEPELIKEIEVEEKQDANIDKINSILPQVRGRRRKHTSEHLSQGIFNCPVCEVNIKGKSNLEKHILRHDDDNKRFQCSFCPKRFHVRFELRQHESSHTGDKPFLCTICGRRFVSTGKLNEHVNIVHENIRNKTCDICKKMFYSNKYLRRHMATHTNERRFPCELCNSKFKIRKTLVAHMKLHANKKEHACKVCDAKFNQRPALHSHMKTRHKSLFNNSTNVDDIDFV